MTVLTLSSPSSLAAKINKQDVPTATPTDSPTYTPTQSPQEPSPYHTTSPQNYCGRPGLVQDDCANPSIGTCNDGEGRCPDGELYVGLLWHRMARGVWL